jgi:ABC-type amino acid transport substrate-binding protein
MARVYEDRNLTYLSVLLTNEDLGWAVRKSDGPLLRQVNEFLASVKADGKLSDAVRRWLPH